MKKWYPFAALAASVAIPAIVAGCEPAPLSQLVVVITTDMAPPKDFDILRIEVFKEGALKFEFEGPIPGNPDDETRIVLPGTLGLLSPEDPSDAIRIAVGVRNGASGPVRVVREAVTTIPQERVAMLALPIQFLCKQEDIPFNNDNKLQSECGEGKTCIAGRCEDNVVDSSTLPDWDPEQVFGGAKDPSKGLCFDVQTCFAEAEIVDTALIDKGSCSFPVPAALGVEQLNLALGVESDGICNGRGCFVVLDAKSDTGWKISDDGTKIVLPQGVCDNLDAEIPSGLKVLQLVRASTSDMCPQKESRYPTCGPWSAVEPAEPPAPVPTSIAGAQDQPLSIALVSTGTGTFAFWTNAGNNSIKGASLAGGPLVSIDADKSPRDLVITPEALLFTAAGDNKTGAVYAYLQNPAGGADPLVELQTGLDQPDGIALAGNKLFWTEFLATGNVYAGTLNSNFTAFTSVETLATNQAYPVRMVADSKYVYWTDESTFLEKLGSVFRLDHTTPGAAPEALTPSTLITPRAIALDVDGSGNAKDLYFATLAEGKIWRIPNAAAATPGEPEIFADGLLAPNGIAVDEKNVYVASRGDGTIAYKPKDAGLLEEPVVIAKNQKNPGQVLVKDGLLLWVNEGPSGVDTKEGSIVKYDISALGQ
jgi:hypothetical protein